MSGSEVFFGFEFGLKAKIRRNKMERKTNRETFAKTWTGGKRRWKNWGVANQWCSCHKTL